MERIKQALELARQERQKHGAGSVSPKGNSFFKKFQGVADQEITYTNTRSIRFNEKELREKRIIVDQQSTISDAYRLLRTQILHRLNEKGWNTLMVTSSNSGEGKTLTAINLAISLAREVDYTVLLVDANLRSPRLNDYFGFTSDLGLSDYLTNDVNLSDILVHPEGIPKFVILPAGRPLSNSSEMLSSPKMNRLVDDLKHRYPSRIVLFDLPPLLECSDALAFAPNVDASLIVVEEGKTQEQSLRQAFELMENNEVIGTVLNKAYTRDRDYTSLDVKQGLLSKMLTRISQFRLGSKT